MGPGILPETTVGKHNPPCHMQMPTKALLYKKEAICEYGPEAPSCTVGQGSFKLWLSQSGKVYYGQTSSNLRLLSEITDTMSFGLKRRKTFQRVSSKASISDGMGVHKSIRYGQLACFGRHYECWKVYKDFRVTYAQVKSSWALLSFRYMCGHIVGRDVVPYRTTVLHKYRYTTWSKTV